jgi:hypothetical protein
MMGTAGSDKPRPYGFVIGRIHFLLIFRQPCDILSAPNPRHVLFITHRETFENEKESSVAPRGAD